MYVSLTFTIKYFRIILRQKKIPVTFTYLQSDIMSRCQKADDMLYQACIGQLFSKTQGERTQQMKTRHAVSCSFYNVDLNQHTIVR